LAENGEKLATALATLRILQAAGGLLRDPSAWTLQTLLGKYAASFLELIKLLGKREREREGEREGEGEGEGERGQRRDGREG